MVSHPCICDVSWKIRNPSYLRLSSGMINCQPDVLAHVSTCTHKHTNTHTYNLIPFKLFVTIQNGLARIFLPRECGQRPCRSHSPSSPKHLSQSAFIHACVCLFIRRSSKYIHTFSVSDTLLTQRTQVPAFMYLTVLLRVGAL